MKVAICSRGEKLDSTVDQTFGRCDFFIFADSDTDGFEAVLNPAVSAAGGAGVLSAQFLCSSGVEAVLAENIGPNAIRALNAAGVRVYTGISGTVRDALAQLKSGNLTPCTEATVALHSGADGGRDLDQNRT